MFCLEFWALLGVLFLLSRHGGKTLNIFSVIASGFIQTFDYRGTAKPAEFWRWMAFAVILFWAIPAVLVAALMIAPALSKPIFVVGHFIPLRWLLVGLPTASFMVRRMRDAGINPLWLLINLVPIGSYIWDVYFKPDVAFYSIEEQGLFLLVIGSALVVLIFDVLWLSRKSTAIEKFGASS